MVAKRLVVVALLLGLGSASVWAQTAEPGGKQAATAAQWQSLSFEAFVDQAAAGLADKQPADAATRQALLEHAWQTYLSEEAKLATLDRPRLLRLVRMVALHLAPAQRQQLGSSLSKLFGQEQVLTSLSAADFLALQEAASSVEVPAQTLAQWFSTWGADAQRWSACPSSDLLSILKLLPRLKAPASGAAEFESAKQQAIQQAVDRSLAKDANLAALEDKTALLQLASHVRLRLPAAEAKQYAQALYHRYAEDQQVLAALSFAELEELCRVLSGLQTPAEQMASVLGDWTRLSPHYAQCSGHELRQLLDLSRRVSTF